MEVRYVRSIYVKFDDVGSEFTEQGRDIRARDDRAQVKHAQAACLYIPIMMRKLQPVFQ